MISNAFTGARLYFIDNLRTLLVILVVAGHLAITYSGFGFWAYKERSNDITSYLFFLTIIGYCQAFVVSLFFMISGYFSSESMNRKSFGRFLWSKILHLGIPFLLFYLFLSPVGPYIKSLVKGRDLTYFEFWWLSVKSFKNFQFGPPWFLLALFIFDGLHVSIYHMFKKYFVVKHGRFKVYYLVFLFVIMAASTLWVRNSFPVDRTFLGFRPANFPRYLLFYIGGGLIFYKNWSGYIEKLRIKNWMIHVFVSFIAILVVFNFSSVRGQENSFMGGYSWHAWYFAFWESYVAVIMSMLMLAVYRVYFNYTKPFLTFLADHTYPLFIVHTPVLLVSAYSLRMFKMPLIPKYFFVLALSLSICFLISFLLKRIPILRKIF